MIRGNRRAKEGTLVAKAKGHMGLACTWTPENRRPVSDGFRARYLFFRMERADWISQQLGFTAAGIHRVQPISLLKQLLERVVEENGARSLIPHFEKTHWKILHVETVS